MHPLDLVDAAPWRETVFTTYALSLSFFEAVVLDRLVRGGGRNALILSDPEGIRAGLSEQGARRTGRDYELEPIACSTGVFHAKVNAFFGQSESHLLVGSGNLTFGGWGMNLEVFEHLHPSFAGDAFLDAAGFFDALSISGQVRHGVSDRLESIGGRLRSAATGGSTPGNIRFVHNLELPIADQLAAFAEELGGATRLAVVSPFYDKAGLGLQRLGERLSCDNIHLHAHPFGSVRGSGGTNWPSNGIGKPSIIEGEFEKDQRLLHAKCFEVVCRRGRLLVSGSVNATRAALGQGNVEAVVVRLQPNAKVFWSILPSSAPPQFEPDQEEEESTQDKAGILRASLEGSRIVGMVLTPGLADKVAKASVSTISGEVPLGDLQIQRDGRFDVTAPEIEKQSWSGGRLVLRLSAETGTAEGFVTLAAYREISRRAGSMATKIMALLGAMETPADVAAILSWFAESPDRLLTSQISGSGAGADKPEAQSKWVSELELAPDEADFQSHGHGHTSEPIAAWTRALDMLLAAFAQPKGPWTQGTEKDEQGQQEDEPQSADEEQRRQEELERLKRKAMDAFRTLLENMLLPEHGGRHANMAITLGHYLVDRNRPAADSVRPWLQRILNSFASLEAKENAAAITSALLLRASDRQDNRPLKVRRFLLRRGLRLEDVELATDQIPGFLEIFVPGGWDGFAYLEAVKAAKTPGEDISAYLNLRPEAETLAQIPSLDRSPFRQRLLEGLRNPSVRERWQILEKRPTACPQCHMKLSGKANDELDEYGMTICCRTLLCKEV